MSQRLPVDVGVLGPRVAAVRLPGLLAVLAAGWNKIRWWHFGLASAIVAGVVFRLVWPLDIEYKADEEFTFLQTQNVGKTEPFPWLGMPTSAETLNPGMSVWVFLGLGKVFAVHDPVRLAQSVQILNVAALVALLCFAFRVVAREEREPWLWAAALGAVNPLAVLFHRKIWPPSLLPILTVLMVWGCWRRDRRWGAFLWALVGVCMGQIHMSGFFLAAGFAAWAFCFDRKRVAWRGWWAGNFVGAIPLIPWIYYLLTDPRSRPAAVSRWTRLLEAKFWTHWTTEPLGVGLKYTLGDDFADFLRYPLIHGQPTYLVGLLHGLVAVLGVVVCVRCGWFLWQERGRWRALWIGRGSETAFTLSAVVWGFGLLLTLPRLPFQRHYLIIAFPFMYLWLARLALGSSQPEPQRLKFGRGVLVAFCTAEFLLTAQFLGYVHVNQRTLHGHYKMPYGAQAHAKQYNSLVSSP